MVTPSVAVIDYGVGNLLSVRRALEACGADVQIVKSPEEILKADRVILPGVGAFGNCINELRQRNLEVPVLEFIKSGKPLLGICVGMQILQEIGEEFGNHKGLGIIPGKVVMIPSSDGHGQRKVPFIGWAKLEKPENSQEEIFSGIHQDFFFYFVHSFKVETKDSLHSIAHYEYNGATITALVKKDNVFGCQFHPEKSGKAGLRFLQNFLNL